MRAIVTTPNVRNGQPIFEGTRIPVSLVLEKLLAGATVDELMEEYPRLGRDDIERVRTLAEAPEAATA